MRRERDTGRETTDNGAIEEGTGSVCPRCAVGCRLRYDAESGRATGCTDAPVNRNGRLCPKGIEAFDALDDDGRLTQPLVRTDPGGAVGSDVDIGGDTDGSGGELVPVSWEEAYDRIEAEFEAIIDADGPDALAFFGAPRCTNEENYLFSKLARVLGTNNVDNRARSCHDATVAAMTERLGSGAMTNTLNDLSEADSFLVIGSNPAAQQPIAFNTYIRPAVNDGATLCHVDPRANRTTRVSDIHLAPRPGSDALVCRALLATIVEEGLIDYSFVAERVRGFEAFVARVRETDVEALCARAGLDVGKVRKVARLFGRAERGAALVGTGIEAADGRGTNAVNALLNLLLITGNIGKRGTGLNLLRGLVNEQGANDVGCRPTTLPGYAPVTDGAARERVGTEWGVEPPATPGLSELDAVDGFGESIRGVFVLGENPAVSKRDDAFVARQFESLSFLCVQDVFGTETTAHADVVLPASAWAEKSGTVTNTDRQVQRTSALKTPPGNARRDRRILSDLGARLTNAHFEYDGPKAVFEELARTNPLYAGMSYEGIGQESQRWPFPESATEGVGVLHRERFANGEKRAPLVPIMDDAPTDGDGTNADTDADGNEDEEEGEGEGELVILTRNRVNEATEGPPIDHRGDSDSSDAGGSASVRSSGVDATLGIHPDDARDRGIEHGDTVVVEADGNRVAREATLTDDVRRHTVFLASGPATPFTSGDRTRVRRR